MGGRRQGDGGRGAVRTHEHPTAGIAPVDSSVAHPARVCNAWLGGRDSHTADQEAAESAAVQSVRELTGPESASSSRRGPAPRPGARVVYVDDDPVVLAHAWALLVGTPEGATDCLEAGLRDVDRVLTAAQETLDLSQPVALVLVAILQYVPDPDDPYAVPRRLLDALAPGSHHVLSHPAADIGAEAVAASMRVYNEGTAGHAGATPARTPRTVHPAAPTPSLG
ncbi:SAM-dependent methyltransferase [Streptomyces sp. NPDC051172]|uniref:SAM-dependent methyltransferase n=1 Tax=Streptomyces sp. NPDC051172 TaxID=3155796 RepID=UPI00343AAD26